MDVNNIKRPAGLRPHSELSSEAPVESKHESTFAAAAAKFHASESARSLAVISQFKRSELEDPKKLDSMVRACVSELVESEQHLTGPLSAADKQALTDFLSSDPLMRRQIETYLRKVLT